MDANLLLFGGSFDPLHHGHLIVARAAAEKLRIGRVVLIPCRIPPHKLGARLAPGPLRLEMCRAAVAGDGLFTVDDWELLQDGPSFTLNTVRHYRQRLGPRAQLYWLIGADSLAELHTWHRAAELVEQCTFVTVGRHGAAVDWSRLEQAVSAAALERLKAHVLDTPRIEIRATGLRERVARSQSIRYFVPPAVEALILREALYRPPHGP